MREDGQIDSLLYSNILEIAQLLAEQHVQQSMVRYTTQWRFVHNSHRIRESGLIVHDGVDEPDYHRHSHERHGPASQAHQVRLPGQQRTANFVGRVSLLHHLPRLGGGRVSQPQRHHQRHCPGDQTSAG